MFFVLQEWIEDPPDTKLIDTIEHLPTWDRVCDAVLSTLEGYEHGEGEVSDDGSYRLSHRQVNDEIRDLMAAEASRLLHFYGLPATPSTADYAAAVVLREFGYELEKPAAPSRGTILTSFLVGQAKGDRTGLNVQYPEILTQITVSNHWKGETFDKLQAKVNKHEQWLLNIFDGLIPALKLTPGRRPAADPLNEDIAAHLRGELSEADVIAREYERRAVQSGLKNLPPNDKRATIKRVRERIATEKILENN